MIQTECEELSGLILQLKDAQQSAGVVKSNVLNGMVPNITDIWDDFINETESNNSNIILVDSLAHNNTIVENNPGAIKDQIISLPSNGNIGNDYRDLELTHWVSNANNHLNRLWDLIAKKSLQYSHVICIAPRKAVTTRSRAMIKKLNHQIAQHCQMYSWCQSCLVSLGAEHFILSWLKVLNPKDVKASTVILNPNEPGSTQIKLPWIWQTTVSRHLGLQLRADANAEDNNNVNADRANSPTILFEC